MSLNSMAADVWTIRAAVVLTAAALVTGVATAGDNLRRSFFVGVDDFSDFAMRFQGDPFCNKTLEEIPKPLEVKRIDAQAIADDVSDKTTIINGMVAAMMTVDANGRVTNAVVKPGWPGSETYVADVEQATRDWEFVPGTAGIYCMRVYIDAEGANGPVLSLFKMPDRAAPKPSVATEIPYPEFAYTKGMKGSVTLSIDIERDGKVSEARVLEEDPKGYAFGLSAMETVQAEWRYDGAEAGRYRLKLNFAP